MKRLRKSLEKLQINNEIGLIVSGDQFIDNQEIVDKIGLENAAAYEEGIGDILSNQIILLCESPSGHYKAYGFISPEYGMNGILIDNIINQQSNYNFFSQKWVYSENTPTLNCCPAN